MLFCEGGGRLGGGLGISSQKNQNNSFASIVSNSGAAEYCERGKFIQINIPMHSLELCVNLIDRDRRHCHYQYHLSTRPFPFACSFIFKPKL